jgi:hypothetical protein
MFRQVLVMSAQRDWHTGDDKNEYYDHLVLLYLETSYKSIIIVVLYLHMLLWLTSSITQMDINNDKC